MLRKPDDCTHNPALLMQQPGGETFCMRCYAESLYGPGAQVFLCRPEHLGGEYGPPDDPGMPDD